MRGFHHQVLSFVPKDMNAIDTSFRNCPIWYLPRDFVTPLPFAIAGPHQPRFTRSDETGATFTTRIRDDQNYTLRSG
jgi:hypothetical protein